MAVLPPSCDCVCHARHGNPQANSCSLCFNDHAIVSGSSYTGTIAVSAIWSDPLPPDALSPDILTTPDPDKDPTMTDTATPAADTITIGDTTYTPRDGASVTRLLDRAAADPNSAAFVLKAKKAEATGMVGLYIEAVAHTATGKPFSHMRFFVVGPNVYVYNRSVGDSRANWRSRTMPSLGEALLVVQSAISKDAVKIFGHPVLVELTADDISAVESGQLPMARFRGLYRIERDYGRFDFVMPVVTAPMPAKFVKALTSAPWVVYLGPL